MTLTMLKKIIIYKTNETNGNLEKDMSTHNHKKNPLENGKNIIVLGDSITA